MSQQLPPHPNLDQLKQQAKDLLRAYRAGDPAARPLFEPPAAGSQRPVLADAQRLIARQYGFASWPKLKQHVESILASQLPPAADKRAARKLAQQQRIQAMAERLVAAANQPEMQPVFDALFAPNREMLAVRAYLIEHDGYAVVIDALLRGVADPDARTRFLSAQAMDHFADPRCAEPLRQLLHDPIPRVRWAALHSFSCDDCKIRPLSKPDNLVLSIIDMALHDPSIKVRRVAAWELGNYLPHKTALAALETLLAQETDPGIRRNVQAGLKRYAKGASDGRYADNSSK